MPHSRPMPNVAAGANELRVSGPDGTYRTFYYLAFKDWVLVFHAFTKKTQQTPKSEVRMAKKRLKELLNA
jgi:phage-related protein